MSSTSRPERRPLDLTEVTRVASARNVYVTLATVGVAIHAGAALGGRSSHFIDDWLYCGLHLLAAASCAYRARRGDAGGAWGVAAAGVLVWGSAEVVFRIAAANPHSWYPDEAQALLFIGFSLAYFTLGLLARERIRRFDAVLALDGLLAGLAATAVAALLLFPVLGTDRMHSPDAPPQAFLIGALIGLMFVITVLGMTGWRPGPAWALIAGAIAINVAGDGVLVHLTDTGHFHRGSFADTLFVGSALLLGMAAFHPSRHATLPHDSPRRLRMPLISAAAALAVLIAAFAHGARGLAAALALGALAVVIVRMSVALELLERSRREALTDDLTGLGNRRQLARDLRRRLTARADRRPFMLALFDLDGFKRYNDTFGHPSGDALLVRLAARLVAAVAPGAAYRMGGDEFCAILDGEGSRAAAALTRGCDALSDRGDAFAITTSIGVVACPREADTVASALRLADVRMYASKASRALDQAQTRDAVLKMLHERDPALHEHMRSVAAIAGRVARRLALDEPTARQVQRAAELHDIGKIAVPDAILHKPGKLDAAERRFMRQYPIVGERILRAAPSLAPVASLVRASHERWDGRGYPDHLEGADAPIGARIIAVCDAYDSMRSDQPYRRARSKEQAVAELLRCAGTQFDPAVVGALCDELDDEDPRLGRG